MADVSSNDTLRADIEGLRKDLASLRESVKQRSREDVERSAEKAREGARWVSDEIETRPFTSIIAAFGIGLVLGRLSGR